MKTLRYGVYFLLSTTFFLNSCSESTEQKTAAAKPATEELVKKKNSNTTLFHVGDEYFSIPSPVQTALLIQKSGANYNKELLSNPKNTPNFSTKFQRAVNLGVFGADLGYVAIYEQAQDGIGFMASARKLADNLGISGAFDQNLMKRFEANMGNKDSVLAMVSDAYKSSDAFLKDNEREEIGVVVLAGGFIEALYYSTVVASETNNQNIKQRIGEQKTTLQNLIKLLQRHSSSEEINDFTQSLVDLYYLYDEVKMEYIFKESETDIKNKVTTLNSETKVTITAKQLSAITEKVLAIRNNIIG